MCTTFTRILSRVVIKIMHHYEKYNPSPSPLLLQLVAYTHLLQTKYLSIDNFTKLHILIYIILFSCYQPLCSNNI